MGSRISASGPVREHRLQGRRQFALIGGRVAVDRGHQYFPVGQRVPTSATFALRQAGAPYHHIDIDLENSDSDGENVEAFNEEFRDLCSFAVVADRRRLPGLHP
jgi:hypothetical protein